MYTKSKTNHIERFNLTLRQKLSRLIRKTLSFSKSLENLEASLGIFVTSLEASLRSLTMTMPSQTSEAFIYYDNLNLV